MVSIGDVVEPFRQEGEALLRSGGVGDIEFSSGTYQVQVHDGEEEYWPFLQFGEASVLRDVMCHCTIAEEQPTCPHLAAAVLRVTQGGEPLHLRFEASLWNQLCRIYAERQGVEPRGLRREGEGHYVIDTVTHKRLFFIEAFGSARPILTSFIEQRVHETEETSIKFSNLSAEELSLWREGRPSAELRYELSFWSDLAKWMMLLQDSGKAYSLTFEETQEGMPHFVTIDFGELKAGFYLSTANIPALIPTLKSVTSPLSVVSLQSEAIERILYHREEGSFEVIPKEGVQIVPQTREEGESIDGWRFVPGVGFFSQEKHSLLERRIWPRDQVGMLLEEHAGLIAQCLEGERVHRTARVPSYALHFDGEWNLHIVCYLFDPGDLQSGASCFFGNWVYLEDDGFYPLIDQRFAECERTIPHEGVSSFVHEARSWLNTLEGFVTHLTTLQSQLVYEITSDGRLVFNSRVELPEGGLVSHDFGDWIYIAGQGFYYKARLGMQSPVRPGIRLSQEKVGMFVKLHAVELELIDGFFAANSPLQKASLRISLISPQVVELLPRYVLREEYREKGVQFFDEYTFVPGEGFAEIPRDILLPERFRISQKLMGQELQLFMTYEIEPLRPFIEWLDPRLERPSVLDVRIDSAKEAMGAVTLEVSFVSPLGEVQAATLWYAMSRGERFLFSAAGFIDLSDPRFSWLRQLPPHRVDKSGNYLRLSALEFYRLSASEDLTLAAEGTSEESRRVLATLMHLHAPESPDYQGLQSRLRRYQEVGVHWLWFLYRNYLSGLLCDDMGLGKTHQAMALLAAVRNIQAVSSPSPYLVVCPTSVVYHWKEKLAEYLPFLRVYVYHGATRTLEFLSSYDLVLTTYGVMRSERDALADVAFEVAVFDEVQIAKNHNSRTHAALSKVNARMRLGLTGTPIENNLRELKALFDLVLPGYLPAESPYREDFVLPIERDANQERARLLRRIVHPFLLRRRKDEVLTELPEKTEEKSHCELSPDQKRFYDETMAGRGKALLADLQDASYPIAYTHIFAVITALKRICDHPAVYLKEPKEYRSYTSGKWELFVELLGQARESRQKVVVFSQYLGMLDIIELYLRDQNIGYAGIRGDTANRDRQLRRFEKDSECEIFVGSLQAAGLGIDLTAASVVIHYDRGWTKARESQATDRVHRLGQKRGVQVFKLITLGTLEERIDQIIEGKGRLMDEVIGSDEQSQVKKLDREDLVALMTWH